MDVNITPRLVLLIPFAVFMMIAVGVPLSQARNEAALPLLSECFTVGSYLLFGGDSVLFFEGIILCGLGAMIFIAIPGAIGIALITLR